MVNFFDQFDPEPAGNFFDRFDEEASRLPMVPPFPSLEGVSPVPEPRPTTTAPVAIVEPRGLGAPPTPPDLRSRIAEVEQRAGLRDVGRDALIAQGDTRVPVVEAPTAPALIPPCRGWSLPGAPLRRVRPKAPPGY